MHEMSRRSLLGMGVAVLSSTRRAWPSLTLPVQSGLVPASVLSDTWARLSEASAENLKTFHDFGGKGDGSSDNAVAWQRIADWASKRSNAGNTPKIKIRSGRYVSSFTPNLAIDRLQIEFEGEVWLINTGDGFSFALDGGVTGAGVHGMKITGWPLLYGEPGSSHGVFARSVHNSELEFNCRGAGATGAGFYGEWLVDNKIKFIMSSNEGGLYSKPATGMHLTRRGPSEETSYNDLEVKISGMGKGIHLDAALGNNFRSGSVQNCLLGLEATTNAWDNKFWGTDFESNESDFRDASRRLQFYGCDMNTGGVFTKGSSGARVFGGRMENITISSGAQNVLLSGMAYNRTGSGRLSDSGTHTRYRDILNIASNISDDSPK